MEINLSLLSANANILIVDDTVANLALLARMLKDCGYVVRPVPNGRLALQAAANEK
jgi:CheY-like chemotaxis protein